MAGGGTGGHVIPALAVARELQRRGHEVFFVGTERGVEARLVPAAGFDLETIRIGGLKRVGCHPEARYSGPVAVGHAADVCGLIRRRHAAAVFSMGGYVAGTAGDRRPVGANTTWCVMEPNAVPGFTNRRIGRFVTRALVSFPETARYFRAGPDGGDRSARARGILSHCRRSREAVLHGSDHRGQPGVAHSEPCGARELAPVSSDCGFRSDSFCRPVKSECEALQR